MLSHLDARVVGMERMFGIGKFADMLGVSVSTLRRWEREGKIKPERTPGGQRRYSETDYKIMTGKPVPVDRPRKTVLYGRVSPSGQRDDLGRHVSALEAYAVSKGYCFEVYEDVGSGLNYNRRNFRKLLKDMMAGRVDRVVVMHKDRLLRFGFAMLADIAEASNVVLEVVDKTEVERDVKKEMVEDMLSIVQHFCSRLYGLRSHTYKRVVSCVKDGIQA